MIRVFCECLIFLRLNRDQLRKMQLQGLPWESNSRARETGATLCQLSHEGRCWERVMSSSIYVNIFLIYSFQFNELTRTIFFYLIISLHSFCFCLARADKSVILFAPPPRLLIDFKNSKWLTFFCILLCICYCFSHLIDLLSVTWLSLLYKFTRFFIYFLFLSDKEPMLETLDYTIRIGSTPTILYFDLYLFSLILLNILKYT